SELERARQFLLGAHLDTDGIYLTSSAKVPGGFFLRKASDHSESGEVKKLFALSDNSICATDNCRIQFQEQYSLSRAELHVAFQIACGISPEHIADARGTSLGTVRTQIKLLKQKLIAPNIAAITRLVLGYSATFQKLEQEQRLHESREGVSPDRDK
ncbi:MAG: hypothetical protein JKY10_10760, partial [Cohaesibacteraceae bacterium]|nr:hypothetical protein [Cohaesibacteraceae bacterium]